MIIRCKSSANVLYEEKFARKGRVNPKGYFLSATKVNLGEDVLKPVLLIGYSGGNKVFRGKKIEYGDGGGWM